MRNYGKSIKMSLVGWFLIAGWTFCVSAQTFVPPIDNVIKLDVGAKPEIGNTVPDGSKVLFYNPSTAGPTFIIKPSIDDGNGNTFTSYAWSKRRSDGSGYNEVEILAATNGGSYVIGTGGQETALAPGYHVFRVAGIVATGSASVCQSDDWQDFVVFVLPPLAISAGLSPGQTNPELAYCEADIPAAGQGVRITENGITFKTAAAAGETGTYKALNTDYTNPESDNFSYKYQWYAIKASNNTRTLIPGATNKEYEINFGAQTPGYSGAGVYKFEVEVEYVAKDKETREYVTYVGRAKNVTGTDDLEINITPKPGKPHITIEAVVD